MCIYNYIHLWWATPNVKKPPANNYADEDPTSDEDLTSNKALCAGISIMMHSSSVTVLCTLLVAILSVAQIPGSHAVKLSSAAGAKLMAEVSEMEKRGDVLMEKRASSRPMDISSPAPQAVCGTDTSRISNTKNVCKLIMAFPSGNSVCSGWVISRNKIATAGHCVLDTSGYASAVIVTCGGVRIVASHMVAQEEYYQRVFVRREGDVHWSDAAVIRLSSALPSTIVPWTFVDGSCKTTGASICLESIDLFPKRNEIFQGCFNPNGLFSYDNNILFPG